MKKLKVVWLSLLAVILLLGVGSGSALAAAKPKVLTSKQGFTINLSNLSQYDGLRIQEIGRPEVYLIIDGQKRWITSPTVYNRLFIIQLWSASSIPTGLPLGEDSGLFRIDNTAPVYLKDKNASGTVVKRWITSPAVMDKYNFSWQAVYNVPGWIGYPIPDGPSIY